MPAFAIETPYVSSAGSIAIKRCVTRDAGPPALAYLADEVTGAIENVVPDDATSFAECVDVGCPANQTCKFNGETWHVIALYTFAGIAGPPKMAMIYDPTGSGELSDQGPRIVRTSECTDGTPVPFV